MDGGFEMESSAEEFGRRFPGTFLFREEFGLAGGYSDHDSDFKRKTTGYSRIRPKLILQWKQVAVFVKY